MGGPGGLGLRLLVVCIFLASSTIPALLNPLTPGRVPDVGSGFRYLYDDDHRPTRQLAR